MSDINTDLDKPVICIDYSDITHEFTGDADDVVSVEFNTESFCRELINTVQEVVDRVADEYITIEVDQDVINDNIESDTSSLESDMDSIVDDLYDRATDIIAAQRERIEELEAEVDRLKKAQAEDPVTWLADVINGALKMEGDQRKLVLSERLSFKEDVPVEGFECDGCSERKPDVPGKENWNSLRLCEECLDQSTRAARIAEANVEALPMCMSYEVTPCGNRQGKTTHGSPIVRHGKPCCFECMDRIDADQFKRQAARSEGGAP